MNAATFYRCIYQTLFKMNEAHDLRSIRKPANENERPWHPVGAA